MNPYDRPGPMTKIPTRHRLTRTERRMRLVRVIIATLPLYFLGAALIAAYWIANGR